MKLWVGRENYTISLIDSTLNIQAQSLPGTLSNYQSYSNSLISVLSHSWTWLLHIFPSILKQHLNWIQLSHLVPSWNNQIPSQFYPLPNMETSPCAIFLAFSCSVGEANSFIYINSEFLFIPTHVSHTALFLTNYVPATVASFLFHSPSPFQAFSFAVSSVFPAILTFKAELLRQTFSEQSLQKRSPTVSSIIIACF